MGSVAQKDLPYWQVNVPKAEREAECPEFLRHVNEKDTGILSTPDAAYHVLTWPEVRQIIADNRLDLFQRVPSELRRYLAYIWGIEQEHGSVMNFILRHRLGWATPIAPSGAEPFTDETDVKILCNDWPYGIDERIVHLVVWTKFVFEEDPVSGDLTDRARAQIESYVKRVFRDRMPADHVIWFKNWASLKSVKAVEHFHVMLFDPDPAFLEEVTNGDVPLSKKLQQ